MNDIGGYSFGFDNDIGIWTVVVNVVVFLAICGWIVWHRRTHR